MTSTSVEYQEAIHDERARQRLIDKLLNGHDWNFPNSPLPKPRTPPKTKVLLKGEPLKHFEPEELV